MLASEGLIHVDGFRIGTPSEWSSKEESTRLERWAWRSLRGRQQLYDDLLSDGHAADPISTSLDQPRSPSFYDSGRLCSPDGTLWTMIDWPDRYSIQYSTDHARPTDGPPRVLSTAWLPLYASLMYARAFKEPSYCHTEQF